MSLQDLTGLEENRIVNVWHFDRTGTDGAGGATAIATFLPVFYQQATLSALYSPTISRAALVHKLIVAEVTPGSPGGDDDVVSRPLSTTSFTTSTAATSNSYALPHEVAVCLSFQGDIVGIPEESGDIRPASRRRGRIYLGPFNHTAMTFAASTSRPSDTLRNAIIAAYQPPIASLKSVSPSVIHGIYSPTTGTINPVTRVSVDDAFDTIRSRGTSPTNKISATVP